MPQSKSYPEEVVRLIEAARKADMYVAKRFNGVAYEKAPLYPELSEALKAFPEPEPEHSPGPWRTGGAFHTSIIDPRGRLVGNASYGLANQTANARLMAAAPELLEACQLALPDLRGPIRTALSAAIEKATGKAVTR